MYICEFMHITVKEETTEAVKRKGKKDSENSSKEASEKQNQTKYVTFEVDKIKSVQTDFHSDDSFQKVVQFSPDHSILATGGADGHLRVWKVSDILRLSYLRCYHFIAKLSSFVVLPLCQSQHCKCQHFNF